MSRTEHHVATALGTVRVHAAGSGPAVLFWPSLLMTGDLWTAQAERFEQSHRVVLVDPPGHGGSEPLRDGFSFTDCADVIVAILDTLNVDDVDVVGNSWGGMIGATFAALHPDRTRHAVLMNCTGSASGWKQKAEFGALLAMARMLGGVRPPLTSRVLKAFLGPTSLSSRPGVVEAVRASVETADIGSVRHAVRSVVPRRPDQLELLGSITSPTLVVAGREDATFPVAETQRMADAIPGSEFMVLDGVGHLAAAEDSALVNHVVAEFIGA